MPDTVVTLAIEHILKQISAEKGSNVGSSPLFVAVQGPQGIGKTTLARALVAGLSSSPHSLRAIAFSIDDLLFGHDAMRAVGQANPGNALLQGRGLPGTHDIKLGVSTLEALSSMGRKVGKGSTDTVRIPMYDKSSYSGLGDQVPLEKWASVQSPVDVVVVEGWCLGCYPLPSDLLADRWEHRRELGMPASVRLENGIDDIKLVSNNLKKYADAWFPFFACMIQIAPGISDKFNIIYKWRLEQEHCMKAANGEQGMSDEQVARFVDRFIPGYIFFENPSAQTTKTYQPPWHGKGLKILVDENRILVGTEEF